MGSTRTFDEFYRTHYAWVHRWVTSTFGADDADDIAQETMLRVWRNLDQLPGVVAVRPWLATIARNAGVDLRRTRQRTVPADLDTIESLTPPAPDASAAAASAGDTRRLLGRALARLTERDRTTIVDHEVHGIPLTQLAVAGGTTANAARQRLFRARRNLALEFEALGGGRTAGSPVSLLAALRGLQTLCRRPLRAAASVPGHVQADATMVVAVAVATTTILFAGSSPQRSAPPSPGPPIAREPYLPAVVPLAEATPLPRRTRWPVPPANPAPASPSPRPRPPYSPPPCTVEGPNVCHRTPGPTYAPWEWWLDCIRYGPDFSTGFDCHSPTPTPRSG